MDDWAGVLLSALVGAGVAAVTSPVGVSGAVFLLPLQISLLSVPSPAVTPTNLLFNIVSIPGALVRYSRTAPLRSSLTRIMLLGTLPGVVAGAGLRVYLAPGMGVFKLLIAALLLPLGAWLCLRALTKGSARRERPQPSGRFIAGIALVVGVVGGIYGIGGGSLLSPILVGRGVPVAAVAPAALSSTFLTSIVGAATYVALAVTTGRGDIAPDWVIGISCGLGGLCGGFVGAYLQPLLPEKALLVTLGVLAIVTASIYGVEAVHVGS